MHGKDISIPKGTEITAYINGNFPIDVAKFQNVAQPIQDVSAPTISSVAPLPNLATTALEISSTPPGADIELDGGFVGSTPSSVGVNAGEHTIKVTKNGFKPWERKLKSSTGNVRIVAELEGTSASVTPASPSATTPVSRPDSGDKPATSVTKTEAPSASSPTVPAAPPGSAAAVIRPAVLTSTESPAPLNKEAPQNTSAQPSTESTGTASITSDPSGAEIYVDSVGKGHAPALVKLLPGKHQVQLVLEGYKDFVSDIDVKAGSIVNVTGQLTK